MESDYSLKLKTTFLVLSIFFISDRAKKNIKCELTSQQLYLVY